MGDGHWQRSLTGAKLAVLLHVCVPDTPVTSDNRIQRLSNIYQVPKLRILGYVIPVVYTKLISRKGAVYNTIKYI